VTIGTALVDDEIAQANYRLVAAYKSIIASSGTASWYLKPSVHFDASCVYSHDATECGAGPVGVSLHETGEWIFSSSPMMEVGGRFVFFNATGLRPYVRGGVTVVQRRRAVDQVGLHRSAYASRYLQLTAVDGDGCGIEKVQVAALSSELRADVANGRAVVAETLRKIRRRKRPVEVVTLPTVANRCRS